MLYYIFIYILLLYVGVIREHCKYVYVYSHLWICECSMSSVCKYYVYVQLHTYVQLTDSVKT